MDVAKIFMSGRSQAVRLPKEYRFDDDEVYINKVGNVVVLFPKNDKWVNFIEGLGMFTDDFMEEGRLQGEVEKREEL